MVLHGEAHLNQRTANPDTIRRYASCWKERVGPHFGHYRFDELTPEIIQQGLTQAKSHSTQDLDRTVLKHLVSLAIIMRVCPPAVESYLRFVRLLPKNQKFREGMVEKAENLFAAAKSVGSWMEGPIFAMMILGLRKGELCGLKPTDIDGATGTLTLARQRNHTQGERSGLKGRKESRKLGLPPQFAKELLSYHKPNTLYLFTRHDGSPLPYQHLRDELLRIVRDVPGTELCTVHDFRAAAVCRLIAAGCSNEEIAEIVGWSSLDMIRHYRDVDTKRSCSTLSTVVPGGAN